MDAWTAYGTAITAHKHIYIFVYIYIILINISYPLPSIYVYWVVTLKGSSVYFVFCRASVKIVSRSRHIWYARGTACTEQSNRASISSLPQSTRPLVHSHFFVTKMFEFLCTLPRVRRNEQRRSANANRKSNEDAGTVLSRKLDVLQPMERWNLKHPTNTELLNLAKDTLPGKKNLTLETSDGRSTSFCFFSHTNIDRSCLQPGSENTMCPLQWNCIGWATQYDPPHLHWLIV